MFAYDLYSATNSTHRDLWDEYKKYSIVNLYQTVSLIHGFIAGIHDGDIYKIISLCYALGYLNNISRTFCMYIHI